ncbi:hypothetical protein [Spirochaeta cellobiosiphila]|uniref:hypothetical protein n=1 Tax=Spirochaeta cellobiosiphila TaxID=504483 RepID=UPI0004073E4A|nr:hypothetical protein [Spirochaeta cellobiosiphila]
MNRYNQDSLRLLLIRLDRYPSWEDTLGMDIDNSLLNPRDVYHSSHIKDTHWLKEDSLTILDALESTTNGMLNPQVFNKLETIPPKHPYYEWRIFIYLLEALYTGGRDRAKALYHQIPKNHILHNLDFLFDQNMISSKAGSKLLSELTEPQDDVLSALQQIEEAALSGFEDLFFESFQYVVDKLIDDNYEQIQRLTLRALHLVITEDLQCDDIYPYVQNIFGKSEGNRLIALSLVPYDLEGSILFLIQSLTHYIREGQELESIEEGLNYLLSLCTELGPESLSDEEFREHLRILLNILARELISEFGSKWTTLEHAMDIEDSLTSIGDLIKWDGPPLLKRIEIIEKKDKPVPVKESPVTEPTKQLELF